MRTLTLTNDWRGLSPYQVSHHDLLIGLAACLIELCELLFKQPIEMCVGIHQYELAEEACLVIQKTFLRVIESYIGP